MQRILSFTKYLTLFFVLGFLFLAGSLFWAAWLHNQGSIWAVRALVNNDKTEETVNLSQARAYLERALQVDMQSSRGKRVLGFVAYLQDDSQSAEQRLLDVVHENPQDAMGHLWLADTYDGLNQSEQALVHYALSPLTSISYDRERFQRYYGQWYEKLLFNQLQAADDAYRRDDLTEAEEQAKSALAMDADNVFAQFILWQVYDSFGEEDKKQIHQEALQHFRISPWQDERLKTIIARGLVEGLRKNLFYAEALDSAVEALLWQFAGNPDVEHFLVSKTESSTDVSWWLKLGEFHSRQENWAKAVDVYQQLLVISPELTTIYLYLGEAHRQMALQGNQEQWYWAAEYFAAYYQAHPDDLLGLSRLVEAYDVLERPSGSLRQELSARTDALSLVGELLQVEPGSVTIGPNYFAEGDFELETTLFRNWRVWDGWSSQPPGLFMGGIDTFQVFGQQGLRIRGLGTQRQEVDRAGFGYILSNLGVPEEVSSYLISFKYKTGNAGRGTFSIRTWRGSNCPGHAQRLPHTDGEWRQAIFIERLDNASCVDSDRLLQFRLSDGGEVFIDDVQLFVVQLQDETTLSANFQWLVR